MLFLQGHFDVPGSPPSRFAADFCKNSSIQLLLLNLPNNSSFVILPAGFKQEKSYAAWSLAPSEAGPFSSEVLTEFQII
jgi:hypothetical protein